MKIYQLPVSGSVHRRAFSLVPQWEGVHTVIRMTKLNGLIGSKSQTENADSVVTQTAGTIALSARTRRYM